MDISQRGTGGEACCIVCFCVSTIGFSRSGGTRGSGFRWISTLGGGAFGICMPASREGEHPEHYIITCAFQFFLTGGRYFRGICTFGGGAIGGFLPLRRGGKRDAPFHFALPPLNFHGSGERGGAAFGGSLSSAAMLLMYPCQRDGRASVLNFYFCAGAVQFSLTGGRYFRGICTLGGGAFRGYMPAEQEGKGTEPFSFALSPLNVHGARGRGGMGFGGSLPSAAALSMYACQRVGRASGLNFVFALAPLELPGRGGGVFGGTPPSAAAFLVYSFQRVGRANGVNFVFLPFRC